MTNGDHGGIDEQMTEFEALMWNLEKDPRLSSNMGNLNVFDRLPDLDRFRATLERASIVFPRLRQRVAPVIGRLAPPRWELDPHFDLDHHLKVVTLGGNGTRRQLEDLVAATIQTPFDRRRPLWEFVIIDGLRGGKAAMLQRLHHTITDGQGGLRLSLEFIDFERDTPQRPPVPAPVVEERTTTLTDDLADAVGWLARRQLQLVRSTAKGAVQAVTDGVTRPRTVIDQMSRAAAIAASTARQVNVGDKPLSPLWVDRSLSRAYRRLDVSLAKARTIATRHGVSINDVFVTGALLGAAEYHRRVDQPADAFRMAMPISQRNVTSLGGNLFTPTQSVLPGDVEDPAEALAVVHDILTRTKAEPVMGVANSLAGVVNLLPTSIVTRAGFRVASTIDFVTSNLRAAPIDTYMAGALIEASYPIGPLAGAAFNLTTMSFRGTLNIGLLVDTAAVTDVDLLATCIGDAYKALATAHPRVAAS